MTEKSHASGIGLAAGCLVLSVEGSAILSGKPLNVASVLRLGTGQVRVTLSAGVDATNCVAHATPTESSGVSSSVTQTSDTEFVVQTSYDAQTPADIGFYFSASRVSIG